MKKLTDEELQSMVGTEYKERYKVLLARRNEPKIKTRYRFWGYGIVLIVNRGQTYSTWAFRIRKNGKPYFFGRHYFDKNKEAALKDYEERI